MKTRLLLIVSLLFFNTHIFAQTIWNGPITTFTKANGADWTQQANQDRITPNVWITRKDTQGIFNIKTESGYDNIGNTSPDDTEWAFGTTSNLGSLTFNTWHATITGNPPGMVGLDMVVHLITDDIYIDLKFTSWTAAAGGGGFSYQRSTDPGLSFEDFSVEKFKILNNPSPSEIKLDFPSSVASASVKVFNILGKEVYSNSMYQYPINVSTWEKGIYLVQIKSSENIQTKKFIKN